MTQNSVEFNAVELSEASYVITEADVVDVLTELGRATTAYHEAPPDLFEIARQNYVEALRRFKASCKASQPRRAKRSVRSRHGRNLTAGGGR